MIDMYYDFSHHVHHPPNASLITAEKLYVKGCLVRFVKL